MKTIIENSTNCSKFLFADDVNVVLDADKITVYDAENPSEISFYVVDLNADNSTLIEGVTEPDDWYGCKYNYVNGTWEACADWVDPRLIEEQVDP
jgi:hypothetical protein